MLDTTHETSLKFCTVLVEVLLLFSAQSDSSSSFAEVTSSISTWWIVCAWRYSNWIALLWWSMSIVMGKQIWMNRWACFLQTHLAGISLSSSGTQRITGLIVSCLELSPLYLQDKSFFVWFCHNSATWLWMSEPLAIYLHASRCFMELCHKRWCTIVWKVRASF